MPSLVNGSCTWCAQFDLVWTVVPYFSSFVRYMQMLAIMAAHFAVSDRVNYKATEVYKFAQLAYVSEGFFLFFGFCFGFGFGVVFFLTSDRAHLDCAQSFF